MGHRIMHWGILNMGPQHREHHKNNSAQGVVREFWDYFKVGSIFAAAPFFFIRLDQATCYFVGAVCFGLFSAYSHQLSHENPALCFWMPMPPHYLHHKYNMWNHNFGMATDIWDQIFGTYQYVPNWLGEKERVMAKGKRGYMDIKWW